MRYRSKMFHISKGLTKLIQKFDNKSNGRVSNGSRTFLDCWCRSFFNRDDNLGIFLPLRGLISNVFKGGCVWHFMRYHAVKCLRDRWQMSSYELLSSLRMRIDVMRLRWGLVLHIGDWLDGFCFLWLYTVHRFSMGIFFFCYFFYSARTFLHISVRWHDRVRYGCDLTAARPLTSRPSTIMLLDLSPTNWERPTEGGQSCYYCMSWSGVVVVWILSYTREKTNLKMFVKIFLFNYCWWSSGFNLSAEINNDKVKDKHLLIIGQEWW